MNFDFLSYNDLLLVKIVLTIFLAGIITFVTIPNILKISYKKRLMDVPGSRSSHQRITPNLGGIAIFFAIDVASSIFAPSIGSTFVFFFACLAILFFVGFMDDILIVKPKVKLYAQILTAVLIVIGSDVRIKSFSGILFINEIPYLISVVFTIFVFIILINAYNLIDGIDGLAGGIALISSVSLIYIFYRLQDYSLVILSASVFGSTIAFLYFNLSKKLKIFMGDTGSMVVGFVITFMLIRFMNLSSNSNVNLDSAPVIAIAVFIIPIVDTFSVILYRILDGRHPFSPDRNHLHHRYLDMGFSHIKVAIYICAVNVLILIIAYLFRRSSGNIALIAVVPIAFVLLYTPIIIEHFLKNKERIS